VHREPELQTHALEYRERCMVSFIPWLLHPQYPLYRRSESNRYFGKKQNLISLPGIKPQFSVILLTDWSLHKLSYSIFQTSLILITSIWRQPIEEGRKDCK
jgi:hypothetical protein